MAIDARKTRGHYTWCGCWISFWLCCPARNFAFNETRHKGHAIMVIRFSTSPLSISLYNFDFFHASDKSTMFVFCIEKNVLKIFVRFEFFGFVFVTILSAIVDGIKERLIWYVIDRPTYANSFIFKFLFRWNITQYN